MEKALEATISGEGKPPVRLLVLDTEEQEAVVIAQVCQDVHEIMQGSTVLYCTVHYVHDSSLQHCVAHHSK